MEKNKYISLGDNYLEIQGSEEEVAEFIDAIQDGEVEFVLSTKNPFVKLTKNNLKKYISK